MPEAVADTQQAIRNTLFPKTHIGGVGYTFLRDFSLGPVLTAQLKEMAWPPGVHIDDEFNFGPIAIVQRFQAMDDPPRRVVLFAAVQREGRTPGQITACRWPGELPPVAEIQDRIAEAVTGVISLDNLLIIGQHFGIWPDETFVVEVEPAEERWGEGFSPAVAAAVPQVIETLRRVAVVTET